MSGVPMRTPTLLLLLLASVSSRGKTSLLRSVSTLTSSSSSPLHVHTSLSVSCVPLHSFRINVLQMSPDISKLLAQIIHSHWLETLRRDAYIKMWLKDTNKEGDEADWSLGHEEGDEWIDGNPMIASGGRRREEIDTIYETMRSTHDSMLIVVWA